MVDDVDRHQQEPLAPDDVRPAILVIACRPVEVQGSQDAAPPSVGTLTTRGHLANGDGSGRRIPPFMRGRGRRRGRLPSPGM